MNFEVFLGYLITTIIIFFIIEVSLKGFKSLFAYTTSGENAIKINFKNE